MNERWRRAVALVVLAGLSGCSLGRWRDATASASVPSEHLLAAARIFERQGKPEKSLELYARVLATDPRNDAARDRVEAIVLAGRRQRQEAATLAARNAAPSPDVAPNLDFNRLPVVQATPSMTEAVQPASDFRISPVDSPQPPAVAVISEPAVAVPMQMVDTPPLNTAPAWVSVPEIPMPPLTERAAAPSQEEIAWAMPVAASAPESRPSAEWHGDPSASNSRFADGPIEWKLPVIHVSANDSSGLVE